MDEDAYGFPSDNEMNSGDEANARVLSGFLSEDEEKQLRGECAGHRFDME